VFSRKTTKSTSLSFLPLSGQRRLVVELDRAEVDVEIELEADAEQDVGGVAHVRDPRVAVSADEDRRELARKASIWPGGSVSPVAR
jgi:hypothetical protein